MKGYSTRDVAELLNLSAAQVRSYAHGEFLAVEKDPSGEYRFSFQDVVLLRTSKELRSANIKPKKIMEALRKLRVQLPSNRPLSAVHIVAEGGIVVVRDGTTIWNPESGQVQFDFSVAELATQMVPLALKKIRLVETADAPDADEWYDLGYDLESVDPGEAIEAYRNAIDLDPSHADARVNLGRLLFEMSRIEEAEDHYRAVLDLTPGHATASFNLALVLEQTGRVEEAIAAYRSAIENDPTFADAYYNIGRLYEQKGKRAAALRHMATFRRLTSE